MPLSVSVTIVVMKWYRASSDYFALSLIILTLMMLQHLKIVMSCNIDAREEWVLNIAILQYPAKIKRE